MFSHYLTSAIRSAKKDTSGFFINLLGLITGFVVFTFAFAFANFEENYDTFWKNSDRIVMPIIKIKPGTPFDRDYFFSYFPAIVGATKGQSDQIEATTHVINSQLPIKRGDETFPSRVRYVDNDFFTMFDLTFVAGGYEAFLTRPDALVISQSEATKQFGTDDPIGQTLLFNLVEPVTIVGVFEDLPLNSHFTASMDGTREFKILASTAMYEKITKQTLDGNWGNISTGILNYFLLKEGASKTALEDDLTNITLKNVDGFSKQILERAALRDLKEWNLNYWMSREMDGTMIARATGATLLLIAILNSISLNSVRMLGRSQEIGLRRIMGASRKNLIIQFLTENIILAFVSLAVAVLLAWAITPSIGNLMERPMDFNAMMNQKLALTLIISAFSVGLLSAAYPIMLLTGMASGFALRRTLRVGSSSGIMRKIMTTAQFAVVTALLFSVVVVNSQNQHILDTAPEIKSEQLYAVERLGRGSAGTKTMTIKDELARLPEVEDISLNDLAQFTNNTSLTFFTNMAKDLDDLTMQVANIDERYLPIHGFELLAGRNFDKNRGEDVTTLEESAEQDAERDGDGAEGDNVGTGSNSSDNSEPNENTPVNVIVNEKVLRELGFDTPEEAIGKTFWQGSTRSGRNDFTLQTIIGVLPDLRIGTQAEGMYPLVFSYSESQMNQISILFKEGIIPDLEKINDIIKVHIPGVNFTVTSTIEMKEAAFRSTNQIKKVFIIIAAIAVILAATGLYALASFMANGKRREVGLRKVLGANSNQITRLFLFQFTLPILVAMVFGLPSGYFAMEEYLTLFPERIDLTPDLLLATGVVTMVIGLSTIFIHILRAARTRPIEVLHHD
jgi:putative ABC transport system permease protein